MRSALLAAACWVVLQIGVSAPADAIPQVHRSPVDVALVGDGRRAVTANYTADSVSLVDVHAGRVLAEAPCGRKPAALACSRDGRRLAVSNLWSGTITLLEIHAAALKKVAEVTAGVFPRGLVFAADGNSFFAALAGNDEVVHIDWQARRILRRWPAPREPRRLALSQDGKWLAAASSRSGQVRCWNLRTGKLHWERTIEDGFNLRGLAFARDGKSILGSHVVHRAFPVSEANIEQGWVTDSRITKLALEADVLPCTWQIALDVRGRAVGDPEGLAFAGNGKYVAGAAGGTHELLLLETEALPWNAGDPGDFLDPALQQGNHFRRVELGGRPLAVAADTTGQVVVANYLLDAIQLVDVRRGTIARTIALGGPAEASLARQGEAIFYDARRSHNQWFSCHTCHTEGHTCGLNFDTLNDDTYGTPKLTPSLYNVTKTGPWTWHGWQKDLGAGVTKSMTTTMFGPKPSRHDVAALLAFLETLSPPPHSHPQDSKTRPGASAERGQKLFLGKAYCSHCHRPPYYTSPGNYDVKLEPDGSPYKLWNPPSLIGLYDRGPYLHDGRAKSLDDLLQRYHTSEMVGGEALNDRERADLIAFLLTL
jgi:cytochrome c peroxidase